MQCVLTGNTFGFGLPVPSHNIYWGCPTMSSHGRMATRSSSLLHLFIVYESNGNLPSRQTPTTSCKVKYGPHAVHPIARLTHPPHKSVTRCPLINILQPTPPPAPPITWPFFFSVFGLFRFHTCDYVLFLHKAYGILHIHLWCPEWQGLVRLHGILLCVYAHTYTTLEYFTLRLLKGLLSYVGLLFSYLGTHP